MLCFSTKQILQVQCFRLSQNVQRLVLACGIAFGNSSVTKGNFYGNSSVITKQDMLNNSLVLNLRCTSDLIYFYELIGLTYSSRK